MTDKNMQSKSKFKRFLLNNRQQVLFGLIIFVSIMALIYVLGFSTNWAGGDDFTSEVLLGNIVRIGLDDVTNNWFTKTLFNFNQAAFFISIFSMFAIIVMLLFGSVNRKKYYLTNYISTGILGLLLLVLALFFIIRLPAMHVEALGILNNPQAWSPEVLHFGMPVQNHQDLIALFNLNGTFDARSLPYGWRFSDAHFAWYDEFVALGHMPADSPEIILGVVGTINTTFILGYVITAFLFAGVAAIVYINLGHLKARKVTSVTYSEVAAAIEAGTVTLIAEKRKVDLDDESIQIDVKESKGRLTTTTIEYYATKGKIYANKGKLYGKEKQDYKQLKKDLKLTDKEVLRLETSVANDAAVHPDYVEKLAKLKNKSAQLEQQIHAIDANLADSLNKLSPEELAKLKTQAKTLKKEVTELRVDKMRFQANSSAYGLTFLSIALILVAAHLSITYAYYDSVETIIVGRPVYNILLLGRVIPTINHAIDIVFIILTMLVLFLCAEKMKFYKKPYVWVSFGFVLLTIARIFFIPLMDHRLYLQTVGGVSWTQGLPTTNFIIIIVMMLAGAALQFYATYMTLVKIKRLERHFELFGDK